MNENNTALGQPNIKDINQTKTRNFAIAAHIDSGKTTVSERMLFITNKIHTIGEVHDGKATTDWDEEEKARGITIFSAAITFDYKKYKFNLVDTPGHVDFTVEVERTFRVSDGAVLVFDAVSMVEPQSLTVSRQAERYKVPVLAFINKLDRAGADFFGCVDDINEKLETTAVVITLPVYEQTSLGEKFCGVIHLLEMKYYRWGPEDVFKDFEILEVPESHREQAESYLHMLIETVIFVAEDEELNNEYMETKKVSIEKIKSLIRICTIKRTILPVFGGAALRNKGIQVLMDGVVDYLPCPLDRAAQEITLLERNGEIIKNSEGKETIVTLYSDPKGDKCMFVFKTQTIPKLGDVTFVRVYSGTISKGDILYNASNQKEIKIARLVKIHANKSEEVKDLGAGDIGALLLGRESTRTGDTLFAGKQSFRLAGIKIPEPVVEVTLETKNDEDKQKAIEDLRKMTRDDPSLVMKTNKYGQLIVCGMGELHLEIISNRLTVPVKLGEPTVQYLCKIAEKGEIVFEHKKQTGGSGQYAKLSLRFEPLPVGSGIVFVSEIVGGVIPPEFIPAIDKSIKEIARREGYHGISVVDFKFVVFDGKHHPVDSSTLAFEIAAARAFRKFIGEAKTDILEPLSRVEINVPISKMREVMGDVDRRRGTIQEFKEQRGIAKIVAIIPVAEMFKYANDLRSQTQGYGSFSQENLGYEIAKPYIAEKIKQGFLKKDSKSSDDN